MKQVLIIFLSLVSYFSFSQELSKVVIVDSLTKKPIPYVAIKTSAKDGLYSDENGYFFIDKKNINNISISSLGYKTKIISNSIVKDSIFLESEPIVFDEVVLTNNKSKPKVIGLHDKKKMFGDLIQPKSELISYVKFKSDFEGYFIEKIHISVESYFPKRQKSDFDDKTGIIRINLYHSENEKPKLKFFSSEIIKFRMDEKNQLVIDLSENLITTDEDGICVGIEMIGYIDKDSKINKNTNESFLRIPLTSKETKDFEKIITYRKNVFNTEELISLKDFFKNYYKIDKNYQPKIGFTIVK